MEHKSPKNDQSIMKQKQKIEIHSRAQRSILDQSIEISFPINSISFPNYRIVSFPIIWSSLLSPFPFFSQEFTFAIQVLQEFSRNIFSFTNTFPTLIFQMPKINNHISLTFPFILLLLSFNFSFNYSFRLPVHRFNLLQ